MKKDLSYYFNQILNLKPSLREQYFVSEISIFGSYARGEEKTGSDLDLLVSFMKTPDLFDLASLNSFLEKELGVKIDLVPNQNLKPRIAQNILTEKIDVI
ncbi:MAG: nucleotidyltransferase family protein [Chloroflexi bacterium]|nr:nucleotidyltransferase family protein [Chloroflexota bacterium]BCY17841.1 nucleotidyltransferase [Leptolinea sp. HRD-7]